MGINHTTNTTNLNGIQVCQTLFLPLRRLVSSSLEPPGAPQPFKCCKGFRGAPKEKDEVQRRDSASAMGHIMGVSICVERDSNDLVQPGIFSVEIDKQILDNCALIMWHHEETMSMPIFVYVR